MILAYAPFAIAAFGTALAAVGLSDPDAVMPPQVVANAVMPGRALPSAAPANPSAHMVRRASDGLFYVTASANGQQIRFVVDTGATVVVLTRQDASRMGIDHDTLASRTHMNTVGGKAAMRWAKIGTMDMAGKRLEQIDAAVVEGGLPVSLLGQNALEMLGTVTLKGDVLTIH